jgi:hypothetical protein
VPLGNSSRWPKPQRRELVVVGLAIAVAIALRLAYVLATRGHPLAGDEIEYDIEGRFAAAGRFLWTTTPYGIAHATTWKTPGYSAWVGALYALMGRSPDRVLAVQAIVLPPLGITAAWALGRSLFAPVVGVVAALVLAVYPNAWQFDVRLYSEALAGPLTILALLLVLGAARVSIRRAALAGLLIGLLLLVRPSSLLLLAPLAVTWWALCGARTGTVRIAITLAAVALAVAPWVIRNYSLDSRHFVPLSMQSAGAYGVFNDDAARDGAHPWAWRPAPTRDRDLYAVRRSDGELYEAANARVRDYISAHPSSLPKAFFYNGITRLWDLRPPGDVLYEVRFTGRTKTVAAIGLAMYWPLLALALVGLGLAWRRGRRRLVLAVAALALAASVVYTGDGTTRYRAPLEPLIVVLAASAAAPWAGPRARRLLTGIEAPGGDQAPEGRGSALPTGAGAA